MRDRKKNCKECYLLQYKFYTKNRTAICSNWRCKFSNWIIILKAVVRRPSSNMCRYSHHAVSLKSSMLLVNFLFICQIFKQLHTSIYQKVYICCNILQSAHSRNTSTLHSKLLSNCQMLCHKAAKNYAFYYAPSY